MEDRQRPDGVRETHTDGYANNYTYGDANAYGFTDAVRAISYTITYPYDNTYSHGGAASYTRSAASPNPSTAPVSFINEKERRCSVRFLESARSACCPCLCSRGLFGVSRSAAGFFRS